MTIVQVAAGLDEPGAGPSYSVRRLAGALRAMDLPVELHSVRGWRGEPDDRLAPSPVRHAQDFKGWPLLGRLCLSGEMDRTLRRAAQGASVLHAHGLWLMPDVYPARAARQARRPFVLSPRGMLGEAALRFSNLRKRAIWSLLQGPAVRGAACLHATSESERDEIRRFGLSAPVAVIPNGVDIAAPRKAPREGPRTVLTLGRIHPKKGLPGLIQAWAAVEASHPDWSLRIVGPDEGGHAAELTALAGSLNLKRVAIEGPLYGDARSGAYRAADLFVLPTLNENFALTVAEALAAGVPVIATKGAPWAGLETHGCGWWIDLGPGPLATALADAMSRPAPQRMAMGLAGQTWMQADFSWDRVGADMAWLYRWLGGEGPAPDFVHFD